jgi:hypothetical protein
MRSRARRLLFAVALAAATLFSGTLARATDRPEARAAAPASVASPEVTRTMDDLASVEDENLARAKAGAHWTNGEIIVTVLLLIFLFPIGLIVLIVLLIKND